MIPIPYLIWVFYFFGETPKNHLPVSEGEHLLSLPASCGITGGAIEVRLVRWWQKMAG